MTAKTTSVQLGERLLQALGSSAFDDMEALLAPDVAFRIIVPPGLRECRGSTATVHYYRGWFGPDRVADQQPCNGEPYPFLETRSCRLVDGAVGEAILGKQPIRYRLELENRRGRCYCEQRGFYTVSGGGSIASLDLVCSGIRLLGLE